MGPLCGMGGASDAWAQPKLGASSLNDSSQSASLSGHKLLSPSSLLCTPLAFPTRPFLTGFGTGRGAVWDWGGIRAHPICIQTAHWRMDPVVLPNC